MSEINAINILEKALNANHLHHAILLYGKSTIPLENVAREMASKLLKKSCHNHPDLFELRPEGKMRQIKIGKIEGEPEQNTMRKLLIDLRKTSALGEHKVAIIYEADRMNIHTANAFLKTLEEPTDKTTIFMLTTRPYDLLDTIKSRCIALRVDCPEEEIENPLWQTWIDDYKAWQKALMGGIGKEIKLQDAMMNCYGLLARFECIIEEILEENTSVDSTKEENLEEEMIEAIKTGERKAIRKRLFADIEKACVACALGGNGVPSVKISRVVEALEKASGLTELNMPDTIALEYFMLSSLRIWTR
ncbi:MAG: hypothetical protein E7035_04455 [Verrucomicrobiaceae bacterium]|nr:hypothetical protein [Verrucomicrobiaceae bacterium]